MNLDTIYVGVLVGITDLEGEFFSAVLDGGRDTTFLSRLVPPLSSLPDRVVVLSSSLFPQDVGHGTVLRCHTLKLDA